MSEKSVSKVIDWKIILVTGLLVVITAGVVGGGVWYYMDKSEKAQQKSYSDSISLLQKEIKEAKDVNNSEDINTNTTGAQNDIKAIDFTKLISKDASLGKWGTTLYGDVNNDGSQEAIPSFRIDGTGGMLSFYIYGYVDGKITQLYKNESIYKGNISLSNIGGKTYLKADWVNLTSTINAGKPNSDVVQDMHQYIVWNASKKSFYEQESI